MRIGQVASASNVGVETIRFYEKRGLLQKPRRPTGGGYRDYPPETTQRITFIRGAQQFGFSLKEVAELLKLHDDRKTADCGDFLKRAQTKRREIQEKIDGLYGVMTVLDNVIAQCPGKGNVKKCSILDAINNHDLASRQ